MNMEYQKKKFANHKATLTDLGNIKILDFKNPDSFEYRIRFLFEEDYYRLHISGDLGELTATNYKNMCYEKFYDFAFNPGYFEEKIDCMSRSLYVYEEDEARKHIRNIINGNNIRDNIVWKYKIEIDCDFDEFESEKAVDECIDKYIDDFLYDYFDYDRGLSYEGLEKLQKLGADVYEHDEIGKVNTGIIDLYMLAFRLARAQIDGHDELFY